MADAHPARSGPGCDGCLRALLREHSELPATVPAAPPASPSRHPACLFSGQSGPSEPISALSSEGRCVRCTSTACGPGLCP